MNEIKSIKFIIIELIKLFDEFQLFDWSKVFNRFLEDIEVNLEKVKFEILRNYGGMGSFNDIVLTKNGVYPFDKNEKFSMLRSDLYDLCSRQYVSGAGIAAGGAEAAAKVLDDAVAAVEKQFGKAAAERFRQEALRKQVIENNFNAENPSFGNSAVRDFKPGTTHKAENINAGQVTDRDGLVRVNENPANKNPKTLNDQQVNSSTYHPTGYPAWKSGTTVTDRVVTQPEKMRMVIDEGQYLNMQAAIKNGENPAQKLGGWATKEPVNSVADMRNKLAVTEEFKPTINQSGKPSKFYVVEFEVQPGVGIREGKAGSMYDYKTGKTLPGNAQQMNFVDKSPFTNPELYKIDLSNIKEIK